MWLSLREDLSMVFGKSLRANAGGRLGGQGPSVINGDHLSAVIVSRKTAEICLLLNALQSQRVILSIKRV